MERQIHPPIRAGVPKNTPSPSMKKRLASMGPAIITAALVLGPGSLTVNSKLGALYGYDLLWVVVIATVFMMVFTEMAARIGMATNQSLITTIRNKWGKGIAMIIGIGSFLVTASFQAGNAIGRIQKLQAEKRDRHRWPAHVVHSRRKCGQNPVFQLIVRNLTKPVKMVFSQV